MDELLKQNNMKKLFAIVFVLLATHCVFQPVLSAQKSLNQRDLIKLRKDVDSITIKTIYISNIQDQIIETQNTISQNIVELREEYRDLRNAHRDATNWILGIVTLIVGALGVGAPLLLNRQSNKKQEALVKKMEKTVSRISEMQSCIDEMKEVIEKSEKSAADSRKQSLVNSLLSQASNEKDYHEAIRIYTRIIQIDSKNVRAYVERASLYIDNEEAYGLAKRDLDSAASLRPDNYLIYMLRGRANSLLRNYTEAINDANMSISLAPQLPNVYKYRAQIYMDFSKWREAICDYDKVAKLGKLNSGSYNNRAYAYMRIKKIDLALADANDALRLDSNNADAYDTRGTIYFRKGPNYYQEALQDYSKAILLNPRLWEAYENRANLYSAMGSATTDIDQKKEYMRLRAADLLIFRKKESYFHNSAKEKPKDDKQ